ncbi:MAG: DUF481 domain-containing protein [Burkholderiales bacterium]|nr:DUF481 domain-containing protein [Burkholderiales bacterium]
MLRNLHAAILVFFIALPAAADVVTFRNGDRLSGRVVHKHGDTLVFESAHAGTVHIAWPDVAAVETAESVELMLRDGTTVFSDRLQPATDGVQLPDTGRTVALGDIAYVNPGPEQSGIGIAYSGRINLSAADVRGNSSGQRFYVEGEMTARAKDYRYTLAGKAERQRDAGIETAANWRADGNYDWFIHPRLFRYLRGSFEHDRPKDVDLRSTFGGGYGLQIVESERSSLSLRGGIDYVTVERIAGGSEDYPALGWGLRAAHRLGDSEIELFHDQDGFLQLAGDGGVILRSRTGLRAPVAGRINASLQLNLDWEENPAPGRKSTDSRLLVGLGYAW